MVEAGRGESAAATKGGGRLGQGNQEVEAEGVETEKKALGLMTQVGGEPAAAEQRARCTGLQ